MHRCGREERRALHPDRAEDRFDVARPLLECWRATTVREAGAAAVERDQAPERLEASEEMGEAWLFPLEILV